MYISLKEGRANGFKRWSDLQQQKYGEAPGFADDRAVIGRSNSLGRSTPERPSSTSAEGTL